MATPAARPEARPANPWVRWAVTFVAFIVLTTIGFMLTPDTLFVVVMVPIVAGILVRMAAGGVVALLSRLRPSKSSV